VKYLLDTNVISEIVKPQPDSGVIAFLQRVAEENLYLSAITLGELHQGIERLPNGKRKHALHEWIANDLMHRFHGRILSFGKEEAETWGRLRGRLIASGKTPPAIDGMIAAIAIANRCALVTRNAGDFQQYKDLEQINPFEE
jgi:predicted nucleic acid-binding protein